ncbi:hypothetical protein ACJX0J_022163, partial [Zea mays]
EATPCTTASFLEEILRIEEIMDHITYSLGLEKLLTSSWINIDQWKQIIGLSTWNWLLFRLLPHIVDANECRKQMLHNISIFFLQAEELAKLGGKLFAAWQDANFMFQFQVYLNKEAKGYRHKVVKEGTKTAAESSKEMVAYDAAKENTTRI